MGLSIVLLAAGQGKRMKTAKPKPLVELADKPLIQYSLDTAMKLNPERTVLVTGYKKDEVKKYSYMWREGGQFSTEKYTSKNDLESRPN